MAWIDNRLLVFLLCATAMPGCGDAYEEDLSTASDSTGAAGDGVRTDALGKELSPFSANIVEMNADADEGLNLLARVEVRAGELLEFYEPVPGSMLISGAGHPDLSSKEFAILATGSAKDSDDQDVRALWDAVADGQPPPPKLAAAFERAVSAHATRLEAPDERVDSVSEVGTSGGAPSRTVANSDLIEKAWTFSPYCDDQNNPNSWWNFVYSSFGGPLSQCGLAPGHVPLGVMSVDCLDNWTGGRTQSHYDAGASRGSVCAANGTIVYRVKFDGATGSWTVPAGSGRYYTRDAGTCEMWGPFYKDCPSITVDILDATGDRFHTRWYAIDPHSGTNP